MGALLHSRKAGRYEGQGGNVHAEAAGEGLDVVLEGVLRVGKCDGGCDNMHMCP